MSFIAPYLLWLVGGAAVPVVIHLASRSKPEVILLPTVRFLEKVQSASKAKLRLKQILLMAMRMALLALFAIILARPCVRLFGLSSHAGGMRGAAVVVLDCSYSMAHVEGDEQRFGRARRVAGELLDMFDDESKLAVLLASDAPRASRSKPTIQHEAVREDLASAQLLWRGTDLAAAVGHAERMLRDESGLDRAIFVVTDMTRAAWEEAAPHPSRQADDIPIYVFDAAGAEAGNGAVVGVDMAGFRMVEGGRTEVRATVQGKRGVRESLLELIVDGSKVDQVVVEGTAGRQVEARMILTARGAGLHRGEVRLVDVDGLPEDNVRRFMFAVGGTLSVLLVDGGDTPGRRGSMYFAGQALAPRRMLGDMAVKVSRTTPAGLDTVPLGTYDCVALGETAGLSAGSWKALSDYVAAGGGLLVALGPGTRLDDIKARSFNEFAEEFGLLPCTPLDVVVGDKPVSLRTSGYGHPVLRSFRGGMNGRLSDAGFTGYVRVRHEPADKSARVLLSFTGGSPALVEKRYGAGTVMLFASSLDLGWGSLPKELSFVPLLHQIVRYLSPSAVETVPYEVGDSAQVATPGGLAGGGYEMLAPSARWRRHESAPGGGGALLRLEPFDRSGFWALRYKASGDAADREMTWAVNLDPAESDLSRIEPDELADIYGERLKVYDSPGALAAAVESGGEEEMTRWLWPALLLLLLVEGLVANRIYRPSNDDARPAAQAAAGATRAPSKGGEEAPL